MALNWTYKANLVRFRDLNLARFFREGTITRGTGEWRARPTAIDPMARWVAWDELPTTIATVWSSWGSRTVAAAAISWSVTMPWRRRRMRPSHSWLEAGAGSRAAGAGS